jgi:hypothetical protein
MNILCEFWNEKPRDRASSLPAGVCRARDARSGTDPSIEFASNRSRNPHTILSDGALRSR